MGLWFPVTGMTPIHGAMRQGLLRQEIGAANGAQAGRTP